MQRNNRLLPPDASSPNKRRLCNNYKTPANKLNNFEPSSRTMNTNSTNLTTIKDEPSNVSCRGGTKTNIRIKDTSNSSSIILVVTPSMSNNDTSSNHPSNHTHSKENPITTTTNNTPKFDVKLNCCETPVVSNQPSTNSGTNTSYCTSIVKTKSEW